MKRRSLSALFGLVLAHSVLGQPSPLYYNGQVVTSPLQPIDAIMFVNDGYFFAGVPDLFETYDTLNYTNRGTMISPYGFLFDTAPSGAGQRRMATNFVNAGPFGTISTSGSTLTKIVVSASNTVNSGNITLGPDSLLSVHGSKVDMTRGGITMEGFNQGLFPRVGLFPLYWSSGFTNTFDQANDIYFGSVAFTPSLLVTQSVGGRVTTSFDVQQPVSYVNGPFPTRAGQVVQMVLVNGDQAFFDSDVSVNVLFENSSGAGPIDVQWTGVSRDPATGAPVATNYFLLNDAWATRASRALVTNGVSSITVAQTTFIPTNYSFFRSAFQLFDPSSAAVPAGFPGFDFGTNSPTVSGPYSAFELQLSGTTATPLNVPGGSVTNLRGRVEITADAQLDLSRARIDALNYLLLNATNHFVGNSGAQISAPFADVWLGSTNGNLAITNLLGPTLPRLVGDLQLWSSSWTNRVVGSTTNIYIVTFVRSYVNASATAQLNSLFLRSTNVVISDQIVPINNLLIDAQSLTVTTNGSGALVPYGQISLQNFDYSQNTVWSTALPNLLFLTNYGLIDAPNAIFFGGARNSPYLSVSPTDWYSAFVNYGTTSAQDTHIYANDVENTGYIVSDLGSIEIQANSVLLRGSGIGLPRGYPFYLPFFAYLYSFEGDISISAASLAVSSNWFNAGRAITLSVTNSITDHAIGRGSSNFWFTGDGFNLLHKPATGDLLGTTVSNTAPMWAEVHSLWAGEDRGNTPVGYSNNVAIGRLILNGDFDSLFRFSGTGGAGVSNAMYVALLEFRGFTTTFDAATNLIGVQIDPGMKIYYAKAGYYNKNNVFVSIAAQLSGKNGGQFGWVTNAAGNAGIFSKGDPVNSLNPEDLGLKVSGVNGSPMQALISWNSLPYATNYLYFKADPASTTWQLLTNFVSSPLGDPAMVTDPVDPHVPRFYRVRVDPRQP